MKSLQLFLADSVHQISSKSIIFQSLTWYANTVFCIYNKTCSKHTDVVISVRWNVTHNSVILYFNMPTSRSHWTAAHSALCHCWLRQSVKRKSCTVQASQLTTAARPHKHTFVADLPSRRWLLSVGTNRLVVPISSLSNCRLLVAELLRSPARRPGMTARKTWHQQNYWPHFVASSRHTCLGSLFPDYLLDINWLSPVDLSNSSST